MASTGTSDRARLLSGPDSCNDWLKIEKAALHKPFCMRFTDPSPGTTTLVKSCSGHLFSSNPDPFVVLWFFPAFSVVEEPAIKNAQSTPRFRSNHSVMQSPSTPTPSHLSWKSVFRLTSSSKKFSASANSPALAVDCNTRSTSAPLQTVKKSGGPVTPSPSLSPSTLQSVDQRSSYNSSFTLSSDSNIGGVPKSSVFVPDSRYPSIQSPSILNGQVDGMSGPFRSHSRARTKSEKMRLNLGRAPQPPPSSFPGPTASQQSSLHSAGSVSSRAGPLSPKAMGASATRFIRRVASAPNAKHLFSSGSRSAAPTKNGLLAPAEATSPAPNGTTASLDHGGDSLETLSSGSSRGRTTRHDRYPLSNTSKSRIPNNNTGDTNGKAAFRRTYSSNSIKVRSVSFSPDVSCRIHHFL